MKHPIPFPHCPACGRSLILLIGDLPQSPDLRPSKCDCGWTGQAWETWPHHRVPSVEWTGRPCPECRAVGSIRLSSLAPAGDRTVEMARCGGCRWWAESVR